MAEPHLASAQFGGFWIRFVAFLADSAIVFLVMGLIIGGGAAALGVERVSTAAVIAWLLSFLYWPVLHASSRQATFGKAVLGLKVTGYQGERISFLRSIGRELAKILSSMVFMVGFVMAAFTGRKQGLHDLVASTYVVHEGKARVVGALAIAVAGFALPFVLLPMIIGGAAMSMLTDMAATAVMSQPAPTPVAQKAAPKPQPPVAATPAPVSAPVAVVSPVVLPPLAQLAPAPQPVEAAEPVEAAKPVEGAKPKPAPAAAAPRKPAAMAASQPKAVPEPKFNDLMTAVLYRDAEGVSALLKLGKWADKPDSRGATPLMTAVALGDAGSAEALLRAGANPARAIPVAEERRDAAMLSLLKRYSAR